mmetsp:Transcript_62200/g.69637  ORF Transcript_62200/g.69637 Transcript_62200/m.69637 type:complete len:385 (-) Transcript_62200:1133-2287(-)
MNQQLMNANASSPPPKSAGQMNQQLTNDPAFSPPLKSTVNAALVITPNNNQNSPINVDGGDDSASFSNISLNGGNKDEGDNAGDDGMDGGGSNNESSMVPKSGSNSTEKDAATTGSDLTSKTPLEAASELVITFKLVFQSTDGDTGDEVMAGDNAEVSVVNKDGSVHVLKAVADSKSTNEEIERIQKEIMDVQYLIKISTCDTQGISPDVLLSDGAVKIANAELLQLQRLLEEKKKPTTSDKRPDSGLTDTQDDMVISENASDFTGKHLAVPKSILGSHKIGGSDTVNALAKQVVNNNTASNTLSSICTGTINNMLTPVWKYSQHQQRHVSIAAIPAKIWKKIKPFKTVRDIESFSNSTKFQVLWSKYNSVPYSPDTPVTTTLI